MVDYESKVHNIYLTANFLPTPELRVFTTVAFNMAEAAMDQITELTTSEGQLVDSEGNPALTEADLTYEELYDYSNFDYQWMKLSLGAEYKLTPQVTLTADGDYIDLTDDEGYVYGNESGSYFMIRTGVRFDF